MKTELLVETVLLALEDLKGIEIVQLDVHKISNVTDMMMIATGSSVRQVKALANNVAIETKKKAMKPLSIQGTEAGEWIVVDLGDVVVHIMLPQVRAFYNLEKLWSIPEINAIKQ